MTANQMGWRMARIAEIDSVLERIFNVAWEDLASQGEADATGSEEYRRVRQMFLKLFDPWTEVYSLIRCEQMPLFHRYKAEGSKSLPSSRVQDAGRKDGGEQC